VIGASLAAAAALALAPPGGDRGPSLVLGDGPRGPRLALALHQGRPASLGDAGSIAGAPACSGDVCQPVVAVPGFEPSYTLRGKRTELAMKLAARFPVEPFTSIFWWVAATGLRLDWTPAQFNPGAYPVRGAGFGFLGVELRWKIDAHGAPVFPRR
jgi:hypothetical protein